MGYLTLTSYVNLGFDDIPSDEFENLLIRASIMLDSQTRNFYQLHDLESDKFELRKNKFKLAVALQIDYMKQTGITSAESKAKQPQSVSQTVGRTSISKSFGTNGGTDSTSSSGLSIDAINALSGTGLLYRGVSYR